MSDIFRYIDNDPLAKRELQYLAQAKNFFVDKFSEIFGFLDSYQWKEILLVIKIASTIISLAFLALIIMLLIRMNIKARLWQHLSKVKNSVSAINKKKITRKWNKIEKKILSGSQDSYKLAVLEADSLFEYILKNVGPTAEIRINNIDEIKKTRKIKNQIIEDSGFILIKEEVTKIIDIYKAGLRDLDLI